MTTTTQTETSLDRFIARTREWFAKEADPERRWNAMGPILAELLADPAVVVASKRWPDCHVVDNRAENLLFYEDPDYKFVINGLVVNADARGYRTTARIHDHAHIYTLYGILDGHQRIERYRRLDDGSKSDHAEIEKTFDSACAPGQIDLVPPYEIHSEETLGERAVAIIVRSEKSGSFLQGRYLPETNGYFQGYGPRQTPIAFF